MVRDHHSGGAIDLVVARIRRGRYAASIRPVMKLGAASDLFTRRLCDGAAMVVNGSFYIRRGERTRPLGLVRIDRRQLSAPSRRRSGGFLTVTRGVVEVLPRSRQAEAMRADDAIETTPILIDRGTDAMRSDDGIRFDRVGVGVTASGDLLAIGAFGQAQDTVSLAEFGVLARGALARTGQQVATLIALDGGPSAHLYFPASGRLFGARGPVFLPNAVCVAIR